FADRIEHYTTVSHSKQHKDSGQGLQTNLMHFLGYSLPLDAPARWQRDSKRRLIGFNRTFK
ncbi:MAG: hypothetical protein ACO20O_11175, partial [Pseudomonadales bacterium]